MANLRYKRQIAKAIGRAEFWDVLHKMCFDDGREVVYLTGLDLDSPYNDAMRFYGNHKKAHRETRVIIDNILDYSARFDN